MRDCLKEPLTCSVVRCIKNSCIIDDYDVMETIHYTLEDDLLTDVVFSQLNTAFVIVCLFLSIIHIPHDSQIQTLSHVSFSVIIYNNVHSVLSDDNVK